VLVASVGCAQPAEDAQEGTQASPAVRGEAARTVLVDPARGEAALAAAQSVLDAINGSDPDLLRSVMVPGAMIVATGRGEPRATTAEAMATGIADPEQGFVERMWDPRVQVDGPIASVWAPYDFYIDGEFSHCGVDAFHLIETGGAWQVQSLVYNALQPPECTLHPDGPPEA
jgi:hypothetical protein